MAYERSLTDKQIDKAQDLRDNHGVTMTDLAHRFGVSAKTLSRLMSERKAAKAVPG